MHNKSKRIVTHCQLSGATRWKVCVGGVLTQTSRYSVSYTEVEGEVSVQQWGTILVDNVSGCDAPEMTQSSLFVRGECRKRVRTDAEQITVHRVVFILILIM